MADKPLSATMAACMVETIDHGGRLVRHVGGYWSWPGCPKRQNDGLPETYFGTTTIEALVARGELEYIKWRDGRNGRFPVAAAVKGEARTGRVPPDILMAGSDG
jgi:hypothetical protein